MSWDLIVPDKRPNAIYRGLGDLRGKLRKESATQQKVITDSATLLTRPPPHTLIIPASRKPRTVEDSMLDRVGHSAMSTKPVDQVAPVSGSLAREVRAAE